MTSNTVVLRTLFAYQHTLHSNPKTSKIIEKRGFVKKKKGTYLVDLVRTEWRIARLEEVATRRWNKRGNESH
jgi:hypothetical protein